MQGRKESSKTKIPLAVIANKGTKRLTSNYRVKVIDNASTKAKTYPGL